MIRWCRILMEFLTSHEPSQTGIEDKLVSITAITDKERQGIKYQVNSIIPEKWDLVQHKQFHDFQRN